MTTFVQPDDLTAKARIRDCALGLFAAQGIDGTSVRSVASRAGVSAALVIHHYRTKQGLVEAVDSWVGSTVEGIIFKALSEIPADVGPGEMVQAITEATGQAVVNLMVGFPAARDYLGRSLLENRPGAARLLDTILDLIESQLDLLEAAGLVRADTDRVFRAQCVCFILLGPVLLARQLETRLGNSPFDPAWLNGLAATNEDILRRGLYVATG
jgi:AcrR family transcriptional regulator